MAEFNLILPGRRFAEPSEADLLYFVVYCDQHLELAPATIRATLSGVAHFCKLQTGRSPLVGATGTPFPRVQAVLRAVKKRRGAPKRERLPVTVDLLRLVHDELGRQGGPDAATFQAAFAAGVYGLLRVSEFTNPKTAQFDPAVHANLGDLEVTTGGGTGPTARLTIRASKTDVFRRTHRVEIHATGKRDCPVRLLTDHVARNAGRPAASPLFVLASGAFLTRSKVTARLRQCLEALGFRGKAYASHSFRIGGCVSLAASGAGSHMIATLGRWRSECYLDYLELTPAVLAGTYRRLGEVTAANVASRGHMGRR